MCLHASVCVGYPPPPTPYTVPHFNRVQNFLPPFSYTVPHCNRVQSVLPPPPLHCTSFQQSTDCATPSLPTVTWYLISTEYRLCYRPPTLHCTSFQQSAERVTPPIPTLYLIATECRTCYPPPPPPHPYTVPHFNRVQTVFFSVVAFEHGVLHFIQNNYFIKLPVITVHI